MFRSRNETCIFNVAFDGHVSWRLYNDDSRILLQGLGENRHALHNCRPVLGCHRVRRYRDVHVQFGSYRQIPERGCASRQELRTGDTVIGRAIDPASCLNLTLQAIATSHEHPADGCLVVSSNRHYSMKRQ